MIHTYYTLGLALGGHGHPWYMGGPQMRAQAKGRLFLALPIHVHQRHYVRFSQFY